MLDCEELEDLAGALALGAAPPHEVAAAETHLAGCPRSHAGVYELAAVARLLAEAPEPVEPPGRLRARILATAREDTAAPVAAPSLRLVSARAPAPSPPVVSQRSYRRLGWAAAAAAVAAVAAVAALGLWNVQLHGDLDARNQQVAAQQRLIDAAAGGRLVAFTPAVGQEGLRGAILRPTTGTAQVVFTALAHPAGGHVYQLWAIRGGAAHDLGVFLPDGEGRYSAHLPDLAGVEAVAVTVEPQRSPAPTSAPVLTAPL